MCDWSRLHNEDTLPNTSFTLNWAAFETQVDQNQEALANTTSCISSVGSCIYSVDNFSDDEEKKIIITTDVAQSFLNIWN